MYKRIPEISKILIREACFADSPSLFLLLLCFEPHFRNITGRSEWIRSTNCCKTVQGVISNHVPATIQLLRCFTMMSSIFFHPTAGRTAKQDFKFRCLNLTQLEVEKKNTGARETTGRWNLVICWFFVGFCGIGLPLGFYSCRTNTRDNSQLLFSPIFMDGKECFTLLNS